MKKRIIPLTLSLLLALNVAGTSVSTFAKTSPKSNKAIAQANKKVNTNKKANANKKVDTNTIKKQLDKAQKDLAKANQEKAKLQQQIQNAIAKAQAKVKNTTGAAITTTNAAISISKMQESINKEIAQNKAALAKADANYINWQKSVANTKANLQNQITKANTDLQNKLAELDKEIAAATTDAEKTALANKKTVLQNCTNEKIAAINTYLTKMTAYWAEEDKTFAANRNLLVTKQTIKLEYDQAILAVKTEEVKNNITYAIKPAPLTNDQIAQKITNQYKKKSDSIDAKIKKLQELINKLNSQLTNQ